MPVHEENSMIKGFYALLKKDNEKYVPIGMINTITDIDEMKDYKREGEKQSVKSYGWNDAIYFYDDLPWEKIDSNIIKGEKSMKTPVGLIPTNEAIEKCVKVLLNSMNDYILRIEDTECSGEGQPDLNLTFTIPRNQILEVMDSLKRRSAHILLPKINRVIFNDPATIVFWEDGTKTVVHATNEPFDKEKGLAMAISKKAYGNNYGYYNIFKKNNAINEAPKLEVNKE